MLPAIELDYELLIQTDKIDNVLANRQLTPEFQVLQPLSSNVAPQHTLGVSRVPSEVFCVRK